MNTHLPNQRGITMAETVVATLLIGFVLVSTLDIVGPMARSTTVHANRLVAANLANELTEEIATKLFTDPDLNSGNALGVDGSERATVRADFDDVDDYNGWTSSPPQLVSTQVSVLRNSWTRSVIVTHVLVSDATTVSISATGLKRITVTVSKNGTELAKIVSLHSQAADTIGFDAPGGGI